MASHWALHFIHFVYVAFMNISAWLQRRRRRQPKPLKAQRSKIPKHLCLNLVANDDAPAEETETAFLQCIQSVAVWCRVLRIETLTVHDRHGVLYRCSEEVHRRVFLVNQTSEDSCESEVEYPLTPPHSESSGSRTHSPEPTVPPADLNVITITCQSRLRRRRNVAVRRQPKETSTASSDLTLYIVSRASGKPAIVSASRSLLQRCVGSALMSDDTVLSGSGYRLTVSNLAMELEAGLPPPDFMIIHHIGKMKVPQPPIEFHGFPPWQNTLTEFHRTHPDDGGQELDPGAAGLISETAFCRALDEYSRAEFRLGR